MYVSLYMCLILPLINANILYLRNLKFSRNSSVMFDDTRFAKFQLEIEDRSHSAVDCAVSCFAKGCETFFYDKNELLCIMYMINPDEIFSTVDDSVQQFKKNEECNLGWYQYGQSCLHFSNKALTWHQAGAECKTYGGMLAIADTEGKNTWLKAKARFEGWDFWIGGSDIQQQNSWIWEDILSTPIDGFTDWSATNPSGNGQNCLQLWKYTGWSWDDDYCSINKRFICEMPLKDDVT